MFAFFWFCHTYANNFNWNIVYPHNNQVFNMHATNIWLIMVAIHHRNETLLKQDGIYKYKTNKEEVYMSFMENTIIVYTLDFIDDIALSQYI